MGGPVSAFAAEGSIGPDLGEPRLLVGALGPTVVTDHGRSLPLPQGRATALLAWLVAHRTSGGSGVSVAAPVAALWPHLDQATAARELRRNLAVLRRRLASVHVAIDRRGGHLELALPAEAAIDVELFERRLAAADAAHAAGADAAALGLVRRALALWRGEIPFVDIRDTAVGSQESVRLGGLRLRALDLRDGLRLRLDPDSRLVTDLEAKVAADPSRELGWRQLMVALDGAGHRAQALRAFQACRRSLQRLGQAPGDSTRRVEAALLAGRAAEPDLYMPEPGTGAATDDPGPAPSPNAALEALVDDALIRPTRARLVVLISGSAGTAAGTAGQLAELARRRGGEVVLLSASDQRDSRSILRQVRVDIPSLLIIDGADRAPSRLLAAVGELRRRPGPVVIVLVTGTGGLPQLSELILHADGVLELRAE